MEVGRRPTENAQNASLQEGTLIMHGLIDELSALKYASRKYIFLLSVVNFF